MFCSWLERFFRVTSTITYCLPAVGVKNCSPLEVLVLLTVTCQVSPTLTTCPTLKCCEALDAGVFAGVLLLLVAVLVLTAVPVLVDADLVMAVPITPHSTRTTTITPRAIQRPVRDFFFGGCGGGYCPGCIGGRYCPGCC